MFGLVLIFILDLFKDKIIYIVGGYIYLFIIYLKEKFYFFVLGFLEFFNIWNEKFDKKGFILFDIDILNYEFIELEYRKRIKKDFLYSNFLNLENEFENFVKELNLIGEEILVIFVFLNNNDYINIENLENIVEKNGVLKIYILIKNILNIGISEENNFDLSINELEKNLINIWNIFEIEKFFKSFDRFKELFLNDDRDSFLELFDKILEVNEDDN